MNYLWYCYHR